MNGRAPGLALMKRLRATQKWAIYALALLNYFSHFLQILFSIIRWSFATAPFTKICNKIARQDI